MPWVQAFPTNNTLINQSVNQIQQNWLAIQNNINTDHFFNTGAPNEGHHNFVQMPTQGADPAVALSGALYVKAAPRDAELRPFYRNAVEVSQLTTATEIFPIAIPGAAGTYTVIDYAAPATPAFWGIVMVGDEAFWGNSAAAIVMSFAGGIFVRTIYAAGTFTGLSANGTQLQLTKGLSAATNLRYVLFKCSL